MSFNNEIAQEIIMDHNRDPYHREKPDDYTHSAKGENKSRGDKIEVFLKVKEKVIQRASFWGSGGAMFTASSSIMTKRIEGKTNDEAIEQFEKFISLFSSTDDECTDENYGEMFVFCGIREFPARVKCSTLPWYTMKAALENKKEIISTELLD
jgi:nitrogen fixation NifU-like protein